MKNKYLQVGNSHRILSSPLILCGSFLLFSAACSVSHIFSTCFVPHRETRRYCGPGRLHSVFAFPYFSNLSLLLLPCLRASVVESFGMNYRYLKKTEHSEIFQHTKTIDLVFLFCFSHTCNLIFEVVVRSRMPRDRSCNLGWRLRIISRLVTIVPYATLLEPTDVRISQCYTMR
jgi:hypothetical protein